MIDMDFLAIAPEVAVTAAAVAVLLVEVSFKPPAWVWGASAGLPTP